MAVSKICKGSGNAVSDRPVDFHAQTLGNRCHASLQDDHPFHAFDMQPPPIPVADGDLLVVASPVSSSQYTIRLVAIYLGHGEARDSADGRIGVIRTVSCVDNASIDFADNALKDLCTLTLVAFAKVAHMSSAGEERCVEHELVSHGHREPVTAHWIKKET